MSSAQEKQVGGWCGFQGHSPRSAPLPRSFLASMAGLISRKSPIRPRAALDTSLSRNLRYMARSYRRVTGSSVRGKARRLPCGQSAQIYTGHNSSACHLTWSSISFLSLQTYLEQRVVHDEGSAEAELADSLQADGHDLWPGPGRERRAGWLDYYGGNRGGGSGAREPERYNSAIQKKNDQLLPASRLGECDAQALTCHAQTGPRAA